MGLSQEGFVDTGGWIQPLVQSIIDEDGNLRMMPWENSLCALTNVPLETLRYALAFFIAVFVGFIFRYLRNATLRHVYASVTGFALIFYPFGLAINLIMPPILLTYCFMYLSPRYCGYLAWVSNFGYLLAVHAFSATGMAWNQGKVDITGTLMILVLKLISLSVCYADSQNKKKELSSYQKEHLVIKIPSLLEYTSYVFALGNLLGGPFMEYTEWKDFVELKGVWSSSSGRPLPSFTLPGLQYLCEALAFMVGYLVLEPRFNYQIIFTDWYKQSSFLDRLWVPLLVAFSTQLKYFFAWKLAESAMTFAGFSFLGYDAAGKPRWGRCRNIHFLGVITAESARQMPSNWNICVGTFLRRYVYERLTSPPRQPGFMQLLATQIVSGVWHGLYSGYHLFFACTVLWLHASTVIYKAESYLPESLRTNLLWRAAKMFSTYWTMDYLAMAFLVLDFRACLWYWSTLHFFPHVLMVLITLAGFALPRKRKEMKKQKDM